MRRSLLFIPSNNPAMLQNADVFDADTIIFDLEDAVIETEKDAARTLLSQFLTIFPYERNFEIAVRINSFDYPELLKDDLDKLPLHLIDSIVFPKALLFHLEELDKILTEKEKTLKIDKKIEIIPIIELASSLIEVDQIAKAKRVTGILLGAEDLATDLEVNRTEDEIEIFYARSKVVIAAKANKIDAIDTPYVDTNNDLGLHSNGLFAKSLGMNAKACIHPNQIDTVNKVFSPSKKEIMHALAILNAEKESIAEKKGAFSYNGKMIDKPILDRARKVLEKANKWNLIGDMK